MMFFDRSQGWLAFALAMAWGLLGVSTAGAQQRNTQLGKAVLHEDGTKTETVRDRNKRELLETVFDARRVVISKKRFLLNANGDPTQGIIYDGAENVIAKVEFYFDELGRPIEERCLNTRNQIFRRVFHQYDPSGRPLQPKAFDYAVNAPNMKPATIDFTRRTPPPPAVGQQPAVSMRAPSAAEAAPVVRQPGQRPQVMSVSPASGVRPEAAQQDLYRRQFEQQQAQQQQEERKKRRFFPFGKKD